MALYLDSSAVVKLVVTEPGSAALRRLLRRHQDRVSSALAIVEVMRAVRGHGRAVQDRARKVLARIRLLSIDHAVLDEAAALDAAVVRSLDAIHLASARALGSDLDSVVTYDRRMTDAAAILGLRVRSPGVSLTRLRA